VEADCVEGATALYTQYKEWAEAAGERVITQTAFAGALTERGFTNSQYTRGAAKGRRKWLGIELKPMIRTYKGE
jgi:phage/plasmid-associated DNA primase